MDNDSQTAKTARNLAYSLIAIYALGLVFSAIAAFYSKENSKLWLELFKSGFLLLGGGLTTIIGYYFGSRGVEEAQEVAQNAKRSYEERESDLSTVLEENSPTLDENSLEIPNN